MDDKIIKTFQLTLTLFLVSIFSISCIPCVITSEVRPKISGQVVDGDTLQAVSNAKITYSIGKYSSKTISNDQGYFTCPALKQWHYMVYLDSPGYVPVPDFYNYRHDPALITVNAKNYSKIKTNIIYIGPYIINDKTITYYYGTKIVIKLKSVKNPSENSF